MGLFITASAGLKTSLDGEADDRKAKVEIKFNEADWIDITSFVDAIEINASLESLSGFATTNTATLKLRNPRLSDGTRPFSSNFYAAYNPSTYHFNGVKQGDGFGNLRAGREIRISATAGSNEYIYIFTGFIDRAGFQEQEEGVVDEVSIGCWDRAKKLIETPCLTSGGDQIAYANYKICDSTTPASSLVHSIADIAGVATGDIIADDITGHSCTYVALEGNVWEELSKIAEAYLAYLYFDGSGKLRFVGSRFADEYSEPNPPTSEWDFDKDNLIKIQKDHTEVVANHVKVQHKAYELAANKEVIYQFMDENTWDGEKNAYNIPKDDQTLPWTDPTVNHFLEFATPGGEKIELAYNIDTQGEVLLQSTNGNISIADYVVYANKVKMRLQNTVGNDYLEKVEVEGKPVRNTKIFNITETDQTSIDTYGKKSKEIENKYFSIDTQAQTVCAWHRDLGAHPRQLFTLTVPALLHCQTGAWVKIILTNTGIGGSEEIYCRLDKYSHQFVKKRKAVTEITLLALIYNWTDSSSATPQLTTPNTPQNAIPGQIDLCPTYTDIQDGYDAGGGTTTPTQVTIAECRAIGLNAITFNWDRQNNLTNFDHYEVQGSEDETDWYSLRNDGVDWKGTLGGVTTVYDEYITHENIPPGGTEDNPTAVTLYYRVRRVTKEPVNGTWSANASATTNILESGWIKKDAITTAKLIDEAVISAKIKGSTFFSNHFEDDDFGKWTEQTGSTVTQDSDAREGAKAGLFSSTNENPASSGDTDEAYLTIPEAIALHFAGRRIRISFEAKQPASNPAAEAAVAYSTADTGNSGWMNFTPTSSWQRFVFDYDVPEANSGGVDYLAIWGDTAGSGKGVLVDGLSIQLYIDDDSISETMITDSAITTPKLAALAVIAGKIASGAVTTDKLYALAVTAAKIAAGAVETAKLAAYAVNASKIAANAVETDKIKANAVTAAKIAVDALEAQFANIGYALTIGFGGTGTPDDPDTGDRRLYLDDDEIRFEKWNGSSWISQLYFGSSFEHIKLGNDRQLLIGDDGQIYYTDDQHLYIALDTGAGTIKIKRSSGSIEVANAFIDLVANEIRFRGTKIGAWSKITNPGTNWFASKTSGWTRDSFSGGFTVDFSSVVPTGTKAVRVVIQDTSDVGGIWARKYNDGNISNTPAASNEKSHLIWFNATAGLDVAVLWLSTDYKVQFAVDDVDQDLFIAYPIEVLL